MPAWSRAWGVKVFTAVIDKEAVYLDGLIYLSLSGIIMSVVEPVTPMAKV